MLRKEFIRNIYQIEKSHQHQMKYRQHLKHLKDGEKITTSLKECAIIISDTDSRMLEIRKQIEANSGKSTEEDILFEKIRKIDLPFELMTTKGDEK